MTLEEGDPAPEIRLRTEGGELFQLSSLTGKRVVLYFYPKASTPGCTVEACEFRDSIKRFSARNAVIIGISPDAPGPQARFKSKYELPFTLLCDPDKSAAEAYGVWKEKTMYGRKTMGIQRTTFLIGEDGRIARTSHLPQSSPWPGPGPDNRCSPSAVSVPRRPQSTCPCFPGGVSNRRTATTRADSRCGRSQSVRRRHNPRSIHGHAIRSYQAPADRLPIKARHLADRLNVQALPFQLFHRGHVFPL